MKLAHVTLIRDKQSPIYEDTYIETVPFWDIHWAPHHVVFFIDEADDKKIVAYRADRVFELVTENIEE